MSCEESQPLPMKIGDTVRLTCKVLDSDGNPKSLEGYRIDVDFINGKSGRIVVSANSTEDGGIVIHENGNDSVGEYTIHAGNSREWPLGNMPVDIMYSKNTDVIHTTDFSLNFSRGRSRAIDER